jgi:hypothetical protein
MGKSALTVNKLRKKLAPGTQGIEAEILFCRFTAKKIGAVEREERSTPRFLARSAKNAHMIFLTC